MSWKRQTLRQTKRLIGKVTAIIKTENIDNSEPIKLWSLSSSFSEIEKLLNPIIVKSSSD
jgi:hypothetical protein